MSRLSSIAQVGDGVSRPSYDPAQHGVGIVHLGPGAFFKAHLAAFTDDAIARSGGDWRITGVSLRSEEAARQLGPQNGLYTLIERDMEGSRGRVIGSVAEALALPMHRSRVLERLIDPATRIVSLTVTEKGYGVDRETGGIDRAHPAIAHDIEDPANPSGVAGLLVWALARRKADGVPPFTCLCCDNMPSNGLMLRDLLISYARTAMPDVADHIAEDVAFPATMVDRITPAPSDQTRAEAGKLLGTEDHAAVEAEGFRQWVIEDTFPTGRPDWEAGGALFVEDVAPYEHMKLRMLNGAHSMLAYAGFLAGHAHVRDVMQDAALAALVRRHFDAAARTLAPLDGVDFSDYADALARRFENPHLAHETYQIAMDGTQKLPQRLLSPAVDALNAGQCPDAFAFAVAAWMRYALGRTDDGSRYALRDPREAEIADVLSGAETAEEISRRLHALPRLFPRALSENAEWTDAVTARLEMMFADGMAAAIRHEAE